MWSPGYRGLRSGVGLALFLLSTAEPAGAQQAAFQLPASSGEPVSVAPAAEFPLTVVCFLGVECPLARLYSERLSGLATQLAPRGVRFIAIDSNRQDSRRDLVRFVEDQKLAFPLLHDEGNRIADQFLATRTPEVFVLDHDFHVRYQGRVDDQYAPGVARQAASRDDLRLALKELLADQPVSVARTTAVGCLIGKIPPDRRPAEPPSTEVTYHNQVRRVLQAHCLECHRSGEIGPFSMESYAEVAGWSETMLEVIDNGRMPPWHADSVGGPFANARDMPEADRVVLREWVAAGMPEGEPISPSPEPVEPSTSGWQLPRPPDAVLAMRDRPFRVPAQGTVEYQYFVVDPGWKEDRWVTAAQIQPGHRAVVHHAIAFIRPPDGSSFRGVGWLSAYVPGQRMVALPAGHARKVPAGSRLVFQMHYTPNGSAADDCTQIGLLFGRPDEITHEVITLIGLDQEFEIPPQAAEHEVRGEIGWYPREGRLLGLTPHMHYRGKRFEVSFERAGVESTLLRVPRYDFHWQHSYVLQEPLALADVDRLRFAAVFDNSAANPFNPDPSQWVNWGDQTWEEMAVVFLEVAEPVAGRTDAPAEGRQTASARSESSSTETAATADRERRIQAFVDQFFEELDTNGDGVVLSTEVPVVVRANFWRFDPDDDKQASRDEVRLVAEERIPD